MLCNAVGGGRVSDFPEKSVRKMYVHDSTLLALRGVGEGQISRKKRYVTLAGACRTQVLPHRFDILKIVMFF